MDWNDLLVYYFRWGVWGAMLREAVHWYPDLPQGTTHLRGYVCQGFLHQGVFHQSQANGLQRIFSCCKVSMLC